MKRDKYTAIVFDGRKKEKFVSDSPSAIEHDVLNYLCEYNLQDNAVQIYKNGKPFSMVAYDPRDRE